MDCQSLVAVILHLIMVIRTHTAKCSCFREYKLGMRIRTLKLSNPGKSASQLKRGLAVAYLLGRM